jgi:hypothetical protein
MGVEPNPEMSCMSNIPQTMDNVQNIGGCIQKFPDWPPERVLQIVQLSATRWSCIAILWVSRVSFAAITHCVASQRVFVVYFVIDSVRRLLDTLSYELIPSRFAMFSCMNRDMLRLWLFTVAFVSAPYPIATVNSYPGGKAAGAWSLWPLTYI